MSFVDSEQSYFASWLVAHCTQLMRRALRPFCRPAVTPRSTPCHRAVLHECTYTDNYRAATRRRETTDPRSSRHSSNIDVALFQCTVFAMCCNVLYNVVVYVLYNTMCCNVIVRIYPARQANRQLSRVVLYELPINGHVRANLTRTAD